MYRYVFFVINQIDNYKYEMIYQPTAKDISFAPARANHRGRPARAQSCGDFVKIED